MISFKALREKTAWKATAPAIIIVFNSFVWFIFTYAIFSEILDPSQFPGTERMILFTTYFVSVAVTAILGSKLFPRARVNSLSVWLFMGAIATFLLINLSSGNLIVNASIAFFLGASVGIGLPSCLSYFADSTSVENRGFVGGVIWSCMGFVVLILAFVINTLGLWEAILLLTAWRVLGGVGFVALHNKNFTGSMQKAPSYFELIRKREIVLYLFPWVMFALINFAETPILENVFGTQVYTFMQLVQWVLVGIFAIIGGAIADVVGRKRVVIAGFVMLGIEYAAMSAFYSSQGTLYLFLTLDGITWGLLFSVFFMALWGDLGENRQKEKYYVLGGLPYLLANFVYVLIEPVASHISPTAAFSFASFFLFLAVLPLMYAPETLPEKMMKERELKKYVEKARKEAEKAQKKEAETAQEDGDDAVEIEANQDIEEILEAAEKYY